jgi:tRNA-dihydrouridine synthase A
MIGREAYHHPWAMAAWDERFFGEAPSELERDAVEAAMVDYMERQQRDRGEPWSRIARHMIGLRNGEPGARRWRQVWSDHGLKAEPARTVSRLARDALRGVGRAPGRRAVRLSEPMDDRGPFTGKGADTVR